MDTAGTLQGEREFQNELSLCSNIHSNHVVSLIGFSSDRKRHRMALVYELMSNGSLQDCLLRRKCPELMEWNKRYTIAVDVAKGLEYLHHCCNPPIIHGDIKPSNILLDSDFNPKIGDFGLARLKSDTECGITVENGAAGAGGEEIGSTFEETEFSFSVNQSPESFVRVTVDEMSPETVKDADLASRSEDLERGGMLSEGDLERGSLGNGGGGKRSGRRLRSFSGKDWWWKQDNNNGGVVKDYVMEWIGSEIKNERLKNEWVGASSSSIGKSGRKKNRKGLDWWKNMEGEQNVKKKEKRRQPREWWKEEYCEELAKKKKKKKKKNQGSISDCNDGENWWPVDDDLYSDRKKKKRSRSRSRGGSMGSVDWWLDKLSGNSHDSGSEGTPSIGGYSSTPSMRGTVCYNAPENFGDCQASEKWDVYSFGVVLLVLVSGRRPLQLNGSPVAEYHRANLLSWAKRLARRGKLVDLVDKSVQRVDREQALLCITIALLCLQKLPDRRPSMREVVGMLCGELESPQLPVEFSPSPPMRVPPKSQKKVR
ncbi:hypothetical protein RHSIM_Rhsim09G0194700 [Rhododendron simsii]|uniref:non-specific serine/threonine protein kinase n=1 Tax=Rhododendron simsii TaxID=118357 RepID=A0A834LCG7_RHOSS|nr:hypothetical protein RHSIM_Rhsim09G0194700 [Rhododendron simsii]